MTLHKVLNRTLLEYPPGNTRRAFGYAAQALCRTLEDVPLDELVPGHVEAWKARVSTEWAPATIATRLRYLKLAVRKAERDGWEGRNRLHLVSPPRQPRGRDRVLSHAEERTLQRVMEPDDFEAVAVAVDTGFRRGELFTLQPGNVDLSVREVAVMGKGQRFRVVPLTARAHFALWRRVQAGHPWLFPGRRDPRKHLDPETWIRGRWRPALERAGIRGLVFHGLRHTFASRLVDAGEDLLVIQRLLGHASVAMTQRYAHVSTTALHRAVYRLEAWNRAQARG